jgi:RNA-dependent RNA polymerase
MEKEEEKTYQSTKVLGQLYDMVERVDFVPDYNLPFNDKLLRMCTLAHNELRYLRELKESYDTEMYRYMAQNDIKTEFEVFSTFVLHHDNTSKDYKFHEEIGQTSSNLKNRFRDDVIKRAGCAKTPHDHTRLAPYAIGMYVITAQAVAKAREKVFSKKKKNVKRAELDERDMVITKADLDDMPLMSFPWIFADILGEKLTQSVRTNQTEDFSANAMYEDLGIPIQEFERMDVGNALAVEEI